MKLAAERLPAPPDGSADRLVLVHGFTQTRSSWAGVAAQLNRAGFEVVTVDAPGHGGSGHLQLDGPAGAVALGDTGGRATYVGYSMGGRLALHLAVSRPDLVERLVLVSSTPGLADEAARAARRGDDERRAEDIERRGVEAFLTDWLAQPMFAHLPTATTQLDERLTNTAAGLASSLRLAGTGAQESLWPRLDSLSMPVLVVAGALDSKFSSIAEQLAPSIPGATLAIIPNAGHVVHLEQPAEFVETLCRWMAANPLSP